MEYEDYVSMPRERVGVLLSDSEAVKRKIEQSLGVKLKVNNEGDVTIQRTDKTPAANVLKATDIIRAIGAGFAPDKAMQLLAEDTYLRVIDMTEYVGREHKDLKRQKARVIGTKGRAREMLEELTETNISVADKEVAIIGSVEGIDRAGTGVEMILRGTPHGDVYKQLRKSYGF